MRLGVTILIVGALSSALLAAPKTFTVTFYTDPAGAGFYANTAQTFMGYTPVTLKYEASKEFASGKSCMQLQPGKARWASGAEVTVPTIQACPQNGKTQQLMIVRPDVPGREIDLQTAIQIQQLQLLQQQQLLAQQALRAQQIQEIQASVDKFFKALAPPPTVRCTSNVLGSTVYTTCR